MTNSLKNDLEYIQNYLARDVFIRRATLMLPRRTGFDLKAKLEETDIAAIMRDANTSDIAEADLDGFMDADAFLLVTDSEGAEHYVAVEVSETVHADDVSRANRNAELLAEWTGLPAHAAAAGVTLRDAARQMIQDTGAIYLRMRAKTIRAR